MTIHQKWERSKTDARIDGWDGGTDGWDGDGTGEDGTGCDWMRRDGMGRTGGRTDGSADKRGGGERDTMQLNGPEPLPTGKAAVLRRGVTVCVFWGSKFVGPATSPCDMGHKVPCRKGEFSVVVDPITHSNCFRFLFAHSSPPSNAQHLDYT